jgi:hypothetical protein
VASLGDGPTGNPSYDRTILWHALNYLGRPDEAAGMIQHLDDSGELYALSNFLTYTFFDLRPFPNLSAVLRRNGSLREVTLPIPYQCPKSRRMSLFGEQKRRKVFQVPAGGRRIGHFTVMSGALLLFVLVGFSPTFYLRPFGELPPLSGPLHVHGAVLTLWFMLLFIQALLVRSQNVRLHRRLGIAGTVVAIGVVAASSWILALRDAPYVDEAPGRGFGNLMSLIAFALCVGAGVSLRRRPPVHRRLMLLGSIVIVAPALSRIFYAPAGTSGPATGIAAIALLLTVVVHDLFEQGRPHGALSWRRRSYTPSGGRQGEEQP